MPNAENFSDIQSHWAQKCIVQLAQQQVINGYPDRTFRPESTITRAEFAAMLLKAFPNVKPIRDAVVFTDLPDQHWAYKAIKFASETRFFEGYPDGTFRPELLLTRVQAIAILANGLKYQPISPPTETLRKYFDDAADIPSYARSAIAAATENFLIVNYPNVRKLQPNKNATRGEIAGLISQALQLPNAVPPQYIPWSEFTIVPPIYDEAETFSNGVAWVKIGKKWGVVDKTGKLLIQPEYYEHYPFNEGLALVKIGGKYRYIDKVGKIIIQQDFEEAYSFAEGLAAVAVAQKFGFIDKTGKMVIPPQFERANSFSEGLASVRYKDKTGFIDKTGKFVIPPQLNWADSFSDGAALCAIDDKFGSIDKTGKFIEIILEGTLTEFTSPLSEGLARVSLNSYEGYIDKTGKMVIPPQFNYAKPFSEGLAAVSKDGKSGYIDKTGKVVIPLRFGNAEPFSQGLARVEEDGKFGFINKTGNYIIKPIFWGGREFSEGLAAVNVRQRVNNTDDFWVGKWGYIRNPI